MIVPPGFKTFAMNSEFGSFILFEQIEGEPVDEGKVLSSMTGTLAAQVFTEGASSIQWSLFSMPQC